MSQRVHDLDRVEAVIVGSGNIGTDLMMKALRSRRIRPTWMVGIDPASDGLARAAELGLNTTASGVDAFLGDRRSNGVQMAFDATSAHAHPENDRKLRARGICVVDLTPAAIGPFCVPSVNLLGRGGSFESNVNMVTCGGQATIPMVAAVSSVQTVNYAEIVATIASKSAGPGTRRNIDEFTRTTAAGIETVGGARRGKAIIILNPADPPLIMRDTVHCVTDDHPDEAAISASITRMVRVVQEYVPGYRIVNGPVFDGRRVSIYLEVKELGDFLPTYAGNLDIMTAAALRTGEMIAEMLPPEESAT